VISDSAKIYNFSIEAIGSDAAHIPHAAAVSFDSQFTVILTDSTGTQRVRAGQTANYSLSVTPVGSASFQKGVSFACTGLPAGAMCSSPAIAAGVNGVQTVSLAITTSGPNMTLARPNSTIWRSSSLFLLWVPALGMVVVAFARRPVKQSQVKLTVIGLLMVATISLLSCGGSGPGSTPSTISVSTNPLTATPYTTERQQFTATVSGTTNTQVQWQVNGVNGGDLSSGTVDSTGMYTAPAVVPSGATVDVDAISTADVTKFAKAKVTILGPTLSVSPQVADLYPTQQQQFTATVHGLGNTQVTWQVNGATGGSPSVGTVDSSGLYTAPSVVPTPNLPIAVSAISQADVMKSDTAMVTIRRRRRPGLIRSP
jgi:hypothetical protein